MSILLAESIERQHQLERSEHAEAQLRVTNRTTRAEQRSYASSTAYSKRLLSGYLGIITDEFDDRLTQLGNGRAGTHYCTIRRYVGTLDAAVIALIVMKTCLDVLGKEARPTFVTLCSRVGHSLQAELRLRFYETEKPELFSNVSKRFHKSTGTQQKLAGYRHSFNREGIHWDRWSSTTNHEVGGWCLNNLQRATGWITTETAQQSARRRATVVRFSPEFMDLKSEIMERVMDMAFCMWPMVCPPVHWANDQIGGWLNGSMRGYQLVRGIR